MRMSDTAQALCQLTEQETCCASLTMHELFWHMRLPGSVSGSESPSVVQSVAEDIQQQKQYLTNFVGGQKAQLSWYVQEVAEQLAWAEAEHVRPLFMSMCCALRPLWHLHPSSVQDSQP